MGLLLLLSLPSYAILCGYAVLSWRRLQPTQPFRCRLRGMVGRGLGTGVLWLGCAAATLGAANFLSLGAHPSPGEQAFIAGITFVPFLPFLGGELVLTLAETLGLADSARHWALPLWLGIGLTTVLILGLIPLVEWKLRGGGRSPRTAGRDRASGEQESV